MITNPRVFDDYHLPRELMHREGAVEMLLRAWGPTRTGDAGGDVIISGPSGVGKTVLARHTLRRLQRETIVGHAYVPCLGESAAGILRGTCQQVPGAEPARNRPAEDLQTTLRLVITTPVIVILDEADDLPDSDALDLLGDIPKLPTAAITHDPHKWCARLTTEHERYGTATQVGLDRYGGQRTRGHPGGLGPCWAAPKCRSAPPTRNDR